MGDRLQISLILALGFCTPLLMLKDKRSSIFGLVLVLAYVLTIRLSPPQLDMINYFNYLAADNVLACVASPYYWREPLFWCGAPVVYQLLSVLGAESLTFVLIDALLVVLCFRYIKGYRHRGVILFLLVLSLPSFLGINNIYRQWIAMMLIIPALVCLLQGRSFASIGWLFVSGLAHNISFVLFVIVLFIVFTKRFTLIQKYLSFIVFATLVLSVLSEAISQKAGEFSTGLNVAPALAFIVFILSLLCYRPLGQVIGRVNSTILMAYLVVVDIFVLIMVSPGVSERVSLFLIFFYMISFLLVGRVKPVKLFYLCFFLLNFGVIMASPSTRAIAFNSFS